MASPAAAAAAATVEAGGHAADDRDTLTIVVTDKLLTSDEAFAAIVCDQAGGNSLFIGTTRDNFEGKTVVRLEYECYDAMAIKEMGKIGTAMRDRYPSIMKVAIYHRTGHVPTKEASVIVAASAAHRQAAMDAVEWGIHQLKACVPIWKKEVYAGEENVSAWKANTEQGGGPRPTDA
jgi:molybdopterin synthase catalytic subunit